VNKLQSLHELLKKNLGFEEIIELIGLLSSDLEIQSQELLKETIAKTIKLKGE